MEHKLESVFYTTFEGAAMLVVKRSDGKVALAADSDVNELDTLYQAVIQADDESNWYSSVRDLKCAYALANAVE